MPRSIGIRIAEALSILEALGGSEREMVSLIVPRKANLILIRATDAVWQKIEASLKTLDVPEKKRRKATD